MDHLEKEKQDLLRAGRRIIKEAPALGWRNLRAVAQQIKDRVEEIKALQGQ